MTAFVFASPTSQSRAAENGDEGTGGWGDAYRIVPAASGHEAGMVALAARVRAAPGSVYPQTVDAAEETMRRWLYAYDTEHRFVAESEHGAVVGICFVFAPGAGDPGLRGAVPDAVGNASEIGRLLVDPAWRCRGVGAALLSAATQAVHRSGRDAVLCVLDASTDARGLYAAQGWQRVGGWVSGKTGLVHEGWIMPAPERRMRAARPPHVRAGTTLGMS